ncbi:hypothetical protein DL771_004619 [Monosporascus sp. 5C6A]|nr:hypothetical protein DL771_004619 [Monosporascus sp. 5C6A]
MIAERMRSKRTCARGPRMVTEPFPPPTSSSKASTSTTLSQPPITCTPPAAITTTVQETSTVTTTETVYPCADPVNYKGPTIIRRRLHDRGPGPRELPPQPELAAGVLTADLLRDVPLRRRELCAGLLVLEPGLRRWLGHQVAGSCPVGTFEGLTYGPDVRPACGSTGNIARPYDQSYTNS